jgi:hypothetical protein
MGISLPLILAMAYLLEKHDKPISAEGGGDISDIVTDAYELPRNLKDPARRLDKSIIIN